MKGGEKEREREREKYIWRNVEDGTGDARLLFLFSLRYLVIHSHSRNDKSVIFRIYIKDTNVKRLGVIVARNHVGWPFA